MYWSQWEDVVAQVFDVLDDRIKRTGRRIWISYLLLKGINDSER